MENKEVSERERWEVEKAFRDREIKIRESEVQISMQEHRSSQWRNPLVLAILAAAIAAGGNAIVAIVNGNLQRDLEDQKSEQTRILEVIKVGGNPDKAAENLDFLLKAGLIRNSAQSGTLSKYLSERKPGTGASLPSAGSTTDPDNNSVNKAASEKAARNILKLLSEKKYADLWDGQISDWFKLKKNKDAFVADMTIGRSQLGELSASELVSAEGTNYDPSTGYKGPIYSVTFINTYTSGKYFERLVVIKEKDGDFRLAGIWGSTVESPR
ncbi:uncharacterized protein DUF4019 [Ectopseudomonas oleovorans]|uniref:Uncharacterized protein DUF4019 n=1 Tax=Ectopseudomonas oleovorans TaxID=301 RepID=A0A397NBH5_ECTOL|nr:DUF4019 domain-containing protein [Pseudomonas oleovorans]RIA31895.1 uncharacterized protein DUF4019 [Pseudomonas oleovorans]